MARVKNSCLTLTNWTLGSLTSDINTLSNKYWTQFPINIEYYYASKTENYARLVAI